MINLSETVLRRIMPRCPNHAEWSAVLGDCLLLAGANTIPRAAALLAQLAHESGECRYMRELGDGMAYEGRRDLGNLERGDGPRFKGRGLIQLTGRSNYRAAGQAIGIDLELHPEDAEAPSVAGSIAAWYWATHDLNLLADAYDFQGITRRINGGVRGWDQRVRYYLRALHALSMAQGD